MIRQVSSSSLQSSSSSSSSPPSSIIQSSMASPPASILAWHASAKSNASPSLGSRREEDGSDLHADTVRAKYANECGLGMEPPPPASTSMLVLTVSLKRYNLLREKNWNWLFSRRETGPFGIGASDRQSYDRAMPSYPRSAQVIALLRSRPSRHCIYHCKPSELRGSFDSFQYAVR